MTVIETSDPVEIESLIDSDGVVIVDFGAESWCVPCQRLRPHYDAASDKLPDVKFVRADIDDEPELAALYNIQGVPTVYAHKDGVLLGKVESRTAVALVREISAL